MAFKHFINLKVSSILLSICLGNIMHFNNIFYPKKKHLKKLEGQERLRCENHF